MKSKLAFLLVPILLFTLGINPIFAVTHEDRPERVNTTSEEGSESPERERRDRQSAEDREARITELRSLKRVERCEKVTENIQTRIDRYNNNHEDIAGRFSGIIVKVNNAINRLGELGADTTELESLLNTIETKVQKIRSLKSELIGSMTNIKSMLCEDGTTTRDQVKESLAAAREILSQIREESKEIREILKNELIPEIRELIKEVKNSN